MINKLKKYVEKDYVVTIITKDKKDIMYVNAISKKNAIEKVSDVILNSSLYEVNTTQVFWHDSDVSYNPWKV